MNNKKKKIIKIVIISLCCITLVAGTIVGSLYFFAEKDDHKYDDYVDKDYNCFAEGFSDVLITDEKSAIEAVASVSDTLGIKDVETELKVVSVDKIDSDSFYRMQQYYNDIPVYGKTIVVSANKDGKATALTANTSEITNINMKPSISEEDAVTIVKNEIGKEIIISSSQLTIFNLPKQTGSYCLAYRINVSSEDLLCEYYVSADDGEILYAKSNVFFDRISASGIDNKEQTRKFYCEQVEDNLYFLADFTKNISIYNAGNKDVQCKINDTQDGFDVYWQNVWYNMDSWFTKAQVVQNKKNEWNNKDAVTLMANLNEVYDYYYNYFQRKGFDNKNGEVFAIINDNFNADRTNAYSVSGIGLKNTVISMGVDNKINLDVVAHEYTHSVIGSALYLDNGESGALNEAYADIMGELIENDTSWVHNDRNIAAPTSNSYPNYYKGEHWVNTNDISSGNDYGGVHKNSTVISHSAYLMWNGIDGTESRKIDSATLSKIWYKSILLLQSNADFAQCRNAVELSARIMLKNNQLTEEQYKTVITAFERVGIENATFTYSKTVKNKFDLTVLNSKGTDDVHYRLEVIKMPTIKAGPGIVNSETPKLVIEKTAITGQQSLNLKNGTYVLRITDIDDERNISETINIKIVVFGDDSNAKDEVVVSTDFTDVITVLLNGSDDNSDEWVDIPDESGTNEDEGVIDNGFAGGKGTEKDPYKVSTPEQLDAVRNNLSAHYIQTKDIDLSGWDNWVPIGKYMSSNSFSGVYDGNGYSIKNFNISRTDTNENYEEGEKDEQGIGLFATVWDGTLINISLVDAQINIEDDSKRSNIATISGLVCYVSGESSIINCSVDADITIKRSSYRSDTIGGVVCSCDPDEGILIKDCKFRGAIKIINGSSHSATKIVGGILGNCTHGGNKVIVDGCENTGSISFVYTEKKEYLDRPKNIAGGIVGDASGINIANCFNKGNITAEIKVDNAAPTDEQQGGIIGSSTACKITGCYNGGMVKGVKCPSDIGGIVGYAGGYSSGDNTIISNCYNTGEITGVCAGGIVGKEDHNSSVSLSYNVGKINGLLYYSTYYYGAVVGNKGTNATITNCYCLDDGTPAVGGGVAGAVTALSKSNMHKQSSYIGFDFAKVWGIDSGINDGYPYLR